MIRNTGVTNMNSSDVGISVAEKKRLTAGQALSERREKLGLTIEECAETLKISVTKMKALEADNDAPFSSEIFLRGYLKNYAKLVDLPANDVLYYFESQRQIDSGQSEHEVSADDSMSNKRKIGGLPYIITIAILVIWFLLSNYTDLSSVSQNETNIPVTSQENVYNTDNITAESDRVPESVASDLLSSEVNNVRAPEAGIRLQAQPIETENETESDPVSGSPEAANDVNIMKSMNVSQPELSTNTESTPKIADARQLLSSEINVETSNTSLLVQESSLISDLLHFTFLEACWVKVVDATDKTIVSNISQANTELLVEGRSPFSVTLGNINGTTLLFNDKTIALVDSPDGRTLRLTVGG
ncbi:MAG: cytoskeleton protein RodZ [Candidatus Endobugula sp.]|jgi:cytoskeleton protein RodZ